MQPPLRVFQSGQVSLKELNTDVDFVPKTKNLVS